MGVKFGKIEPVHMGDYYPLYFVDNRLAGMCYLCVHDRGELVEEQKHHSFVVDVAGESRMNDMGVTDQLIGLMLHVTAVPATSITTYCHGKIKIRANERSVHMVGRINNIQHRTPGQWASSLQDIGENIYTDLVRNNNNSELWTDILNCQLFVRKLIEHFGLVYPSNISTCSNLPSTIIDLTILSFRSPATTGRILSSADSANEDDNNNSI